MKVSVLVITYNNERFITEAIDSIVMQKVDFDFEIIIGEDHSTDRTREIVFDFRKRYPDKIHLLLNEKNVGGRKNFTQILKASQGEYIALLEGDDYWTSPNKLQKQVDFLDNHPDFTICFHWAGWLDQESGEIKSWKYGPPIIKPYYTIDDLLKHSNFIPTCSVMFRNNLFGEFPKWFWETGIGDFPLHILNAQHGKIGYIDEAMSVYRVHDAGIRSGSSPAVRLERLIGTYDLVNASLGFKYNRIIRKQESNLFFDLAAEYVKRGDLPKAVRAAVKSIISNPLNKRSFVRLLRHFMRIPRKAAQRVSEKGMGVTSHKGISRTTGASHKALHSNKLERSLK